MTEAKKSLRLTPVEIKEQLEIDQAAEDWGVRVEYTHRFRKHFKEFYAYKWGLYTYMALVIIAAFFLGYATHRLDVDWSSCMNFTQTAFPDVDPVRYCRIVLGRG